MHVDDGWDVKPRTRREKPLDRLSRIMVVTNGSFPDHCGVPGLRWQPHWLVKQLFREKRERRDRCRC